MDLLSLTCRHTASSLIRNFEQRFNMSSLISRNRQTISRLGVATGRTVRTETTLSGTKPRSIAARSPKTWRLQKQSQHSATLLRRSGRSRRPKTTLAAEPATVQQPTRQTFNSTALRDILSKRRIVPIPRWISPGFNTFTLSELFGHASFVLVAVSYAVDDFLLLRMIAVVGSTGMLVFTYFHPHGRVLWLPFKWNCLFIAINSYRIGKVYWNRYQASRLSPELLDLYSHNFYLMDQVDFARLVSIAKIEEFPKDTELVGQGELNGKIRLVVDGECRVIRDGKLTYKLQSGNFVSEAGLHAGLLLPGSMESCCTVVADSDKARLLTWDRTELVELMELYPGLMRSFKATLSWDVIRKLKGQRSLLSSGTVQDAEEWTARRLRQTNDRYAGILHNILSDPQQIPKRWKELNKYRQIHHIDDKHHEAALRQVGWTVEELEAARKQEEDPIIAAEGIKWYLNAAFHRIFS